MVNFVRRVCGGAADTHAFSFFLRLRACGTPYKCRSGINDRPCTLSVGWGLPHRRKTVAMTRTVRRGAPYGEFRA